MKCVNHEFYDEDKYWRDSPITELVPQYMPAWLKGLRREDFRVLFDFAIRSRKQN